MKKLYKSSTNKVFAGVIGGIGEYYATDPVILRLAYVVATIFSGLFPGVLVYIISTFIVPDKPTIVHMEAETKEDK